MLYSIPLSKQEVVTDTPLAVRSLRSFYFVAKKKSWMTASVELPVVTIVVDGKVIAKKLPIYPFVIQKDAGVQEYKSPMIDSRLVSIPLSINVNCSEIKVRVEGLSENSIELLFGCSDIPVEVEFATCFDTLHVDDTMNDYNVQLTEGAESIFVYPYTVHEHYIYNPNFGEEMPTSEQYICNTANEGYVSGEIRVGSRDEYMPDFDIELITPAMLQSWKDVLFSFSKTTTKNVSMKLIDAEVGDGCIVYFNYKKVFS